MWAQRLERLDSLIIMPIFAITKPQRWGENGSHKEGDTADEIQQPFEKGPGGTHDGRSLQVSLSHEYMFIDTN